MNSVRSIKKEQSLVGRRRDRPCTSGKERRIAEGVTVKKKKEPYKAELAAREAARRRSRNRSWMFSAADQKKTGFGAEGKTASAK